MWSNPITVSDDRSPATAILPAVSVDPITGVVAVAWQVPNGRATMKRCAIALILMLTPYATVLHWSEQRAHCPRMCNLYSMARSRDDVRRLFRVDQDRTGNQPPLPAIFPDQLAPVIHVDRDGQRVMEAMRSGGVATVHADGDPNAARRPVAQ